MDAQSTVAIEIRPRVAVLDADPDLAKDVPPGQLPVARARALAPTIALPPGDWRPPAPRGGEHRGHLGLLVLSGLMTRNINLLGRVSMELLGAEDLLRPYDDGEPGASVPHSVTYTVHEPTRLAVLDRSFAERVVPWPEVTSALIARAVRRSLWLDAHLAILENPSVEIRTLLFLWHLADRWGRVSPTGVHVGVRVTHNTLGRLVRAQRPSVTRAISGLTRRGALSCDHDGSWVLHGQAPAGIGTSEAA
jgi:CRP/FNR family transcriptional regulator, cyclic AMP receptor protein